MATPENYTTLFPYLFINGAPEYIDFLVQGLGGVELGRSVHPNGLIANCRIRFGNTTLMLSEANDRYSPSTGSFYLYVDDADAAVAQAIQHGAKLEMAVADRDYGDRQGGVVDPKGLIWWLSQRLVEGDYDD